MESSQEDESQGKEDESQGSCQDRESSVEEKDLVLESSSARRVCDVPVQPKRKRDTKAQSKSHQQAEHQAQQAKHQARRRDLVLEIHNKILTSAAAAPNRREAKIKDFAVNLASLVARLTGMDEIQRPIYEQSACLIIEILLN